MSTHKLLLSSCQPLMGYSGGAVWLDVVQGPNLVERLSQQV